MAFSSAMKALHFNRLRLAVGNPHHATGVLCKSLLKKMTLPLCVWLLALASGTANAADKAGSAKAPEASIEKLESAQRNNKVSE